MCPVGCNKRKEKRFTPIAKARGPRAKHMMGQLIGRFGTHDYFAVKNAGFSKNGLYRFFDGKNEKGRRSLIVLGMEDDIVFARTIKKSEDIKNCIDLFLEQKQKALEKVRSGRKRF